VAEDAGIPRAVAEALAAYIDDVEQLEILLLLRRARERYHSAAAVAAELFVDEESSAQHLERLGAKNLVDVRIENSVLYRYSPVSPEIERSIDQIAEAFANRRMAVTRLIGAVRPDPARVFAEAFRLAPQKKAKKDKKE
jgi:hypothetical protein